MTVPEPLTERGMIHALLAATLLAQAAGWDRLRALAASDRQAEQAAFREQSRHLVRAGYWRRQLLHRKPFEVVMEEWA